MHLKWSIALLAMSLAGPLQAETLQVTAVRAWSFPDITRVAIEINGEFRFHADRAHDPERIYFDLSGAVPQIDGRRVMNKEVGDKLLKRVRVAEPRKGTTRIVLDVEPNVEYTASQLASPDRLIVELHAVNTDKPVTKAEPAPPPKLDAEVRPVELPTTPLSAKSTPPRIAPAPTTVVLPMSPSATTPSEPSAHSARINGSASLTRALGLKVNRIVIDAGHGGHDEGTKGPAGLKEKDLVLDVALRLGKLIEERLGSEVIYTRNDDTFVPLEERTAIANRNHADLFLSIHANSSPATDVAGVETYYLNFSNSAEATNVAARENASSQTSVFELKQLVQKISLHDKIDESKQFASSVQTSLHAFTARSFPSARNRGVRKAPFIVLIGASMPSILTEIGFVTNARQEELLSKPEYRQKLADSLYRGLFRYTQTLSHFEVASHRVQADPVTR